MSYVTITGLTYRLYYPPGGHWGVGGGVPRRGEGGNTGGGGQGGLTDAGGKCLYESNTKGWEIKGHDGWTVDT